MQRTSREQVFASARQCLRRARDMFLQASAAAWRGFMALQLESPMREDQSERSC
jgi:hypothetical protein